MALLTCIIGVLLLTSNILAVPVSSDLGQFDQSYLPTEIDGSLENQNDSKLLKTISVVYVYATHREGSTAGSSPRGIVVISQAEDTSGPKNIIARDADDDMLRKAKMAYSVYERDFSLAHNSGEACGKVQKLEDGRSVFSMWDIPQAQSNERQISRPVELLSVESMDDGASHMQKIFCGSEGMERGQDTAEGKSMYCSNGLEMVMSVSPGGSSRNPTSLFKKITITHRAFESDGTMSTSMIINPHGPSHFRCRGSSEPGMSCEPARGSIIVTRHGRYEPTHTRRGSEKTLALHSTDEINSTADMEGEINGVPAFLHDQILQEITKRSSEGLSNSVLDLPRRLERDGVSVSPSAILTLFRRERNPFPGVLPSPYLDRCYYCSLWQCFNSFIDCIYAGDPQMAYYEHLVQQYQKNQTAKAEALVSEAKKNEAEEKNQKKKGKDHKETKDAQNKAKEAKKEMDQIASKVKDVQSFLQYEATATPVIRNRNIRKRSADQVQAAEYTAEEHAFRQSSSVASDQSTPITIQQIEITEQELTMSVEKNRKAAESEGNVNVRKRLMAERQKLLEQREKLREQKQKLREEAKRLKQENKQLEELRKIEESDREGTNETRKELEEQEKELDAQRKRLEAERKKADKLRKIEDADRAGNEAQRKTLDGLRERLEAEREIAEKMDEQREKVAEEKENLREQQERIKEEQQKQREMEELQREEREHEKEEIIKQQEAAKGASFVIELVHGLKQSGGPDLMEVQTLTVDLRSTSTNTASSRSNGPYASPFTIEGTPVSISIDFSASVNTSASISGSASLSKPRSESIYRLNPEVTPSPITLSTRSTMGPNFTASQMALSISESRSGINPEFIFPRETSRSETSIGAGASLAGAEASVAGGAASLASASASLASASVNVRAVPYQARSIAKRRLPDSSFPTLGNCYYCTAIQCSLHDSACIYAPDQDTADLLHAQRKDEEEINRPKKMEPKKDDKKAENSDKQAQIEADKKLEKALQDEIERLKKEEKDEAEKAKEDAEKVKEDAEARAKEEKKMAKEEKKKAEAKANDEEEKAKAKAKNDKAKAKSKAKDDEERAKAKAKDDEKKAKAKADDEEEKAKSKAKNDKEKAKAKAKEDEERAKSKADDDEEKAKAKAKANSDGDDDDDGKKEKAGQPPPPLLKDDDNNKYAVAQEEQVANTYAEMMAAKQSGGVGEDTLSLETEFRD